MGLLFRTEKEQEAEEDERRSTTTMATTRCDLLWFQEHTGETTHVVIDPMRRDPTNRTMQGIHLPELNFPIQCLSSNHGWLLLLSRTNSSLFFFNPYTHSKLNLPYRPSLFEAAAFSAQPTSPDCVVYAVEHSRVWINIGVLRVGEERPKWRNYSFKAENFGTVRAAVVSRSGGRLWCLDCLGRVGVFEDEVWRVVCGVKSEKVRSFVGVVEVGGELVVGMRRKTISLTTLGEVYRLKRKSGGGEEMEWEVIGGGEMGGVYLGGSCGGVEGLKGEEGEVFFADEHSGMCSVYKIEGSGLKCITMMGNPWLGKHCTPVWIQRSD